MIKNKDSYLTSAQAAQILGYTPDHIRLLILQGRIKAEKLGHNWLIKPRAIANIKRRRKSKTKES